MATPLVRICHKS